MSEKPPSKAPAKGPAPIPVGVSAHFGEIILFIVAIILLSSVAGFVVSFFSADGGGVKDFFLRVYEFVTTVSTIISMLALVIAVYAFMRIGELASEETKKLGLALNWNSEKKQKNVRWERVENYMTSLNPSDWKIAILEADNILDQVVERMGYQGTTLGERMKNIEASDFPYLDDAWTAHKTRNAIAHKGTDYEINRSDAEQTINIYHRIFKELGYL